MSSPNLWHEPFKIFGTLAVAESQDRNSLPRVPAKDKGARSQSRSGSRTMATAGLPSLLGMYRHLPRAKRRLLQALLVQWATESLSESARHLSLRHLIHSQPASMVLESMCEIAAYTALAPLRLLTTELSVFRRFDWRCVHLNSKILPIFLPNLCSGMLKGACSYFLQPQLTKMVNNLIPRASAPTLDMAYHLLPNLGLILCMSAVLLPCRVLSDIIRIRTDLYVLNGDSDHSIIPIDDTYENDVVASGLRTEDYDYYDAATRYLAVSVLPRFLIEFLRLVAVPLSASLSGVIHHNGI